MNQSVKRLKCMDIGAWRASTAQELGSYHKKFLELAKKRESAEPIFKSVLAVRQQLSPVDMYCYLRARFGEPNGFQNFLRSDDSDNWIHWDFNLKAEGEEVYICGTYREVHFMLSEKLTDDDWRDLVIRACFKNRFGLTRGTYERGV
jgi:hypothetical protein